MTAGSKLARLGWMQYWRWMRKYHRFEVRGLGNLLRTGAAMIVGYHGRPGARDLCMLQTLLLEEHGVMTRAVAHDLIFRTPGLRHVADGLKFISRDHAAIAAAVARGEKLVITPGGVEEGWGSFRQRYRVKWGQRMGYLRLALRYQLPVIPVAAAGVDDAFHGLFDANQFWTQVGLRPGYGVWVGVGPFGIWPFTAPFPSRIVQYVGDPIDLEAEGKFDPNDEQRLTRMHEVISTSVQSLLNRALAETSGRRAQPEELTWIDQAARTRETGRSSSASPEAAVRRSPGR